jgi:hypothetical protein
MACATGQNRADAEQSAGATHDSPRPPVTSERLNTTSVRASSASTNRRSLVHAKQIHTVAKCQKRLEPSHAATTADVDLTASSTMLYYGD